MQVEQKTIFDFSFVDIDGKEREMTAFRGKSLMIVNVASECGFTPQYQQLQELYDHYKEKLEIIAFPCNDFGGQEPGNEEEIKAFCASHYGIHFTLGAKINIQKKPVHPIYVWLMEQAEKMNHKSEVDWNFHKFLIDKNGKLVASLASSVSPFDDIILHMLESK